MNARNSKPTTRARAGRPAAASKPKATEGASGVESAEASSKTRINLRIDADDFERLMIHCVKRRQQPGELIGELIREHLKEWKVQSQHPAEGRRVWRSAKHSPGCGIDRPGGWREVVGRRTGAGLAGRIGRTGREAGGLSPGGRAPLPEWVRAGAGGVAPPAS